MLFSEARFERYAMQCEEISQTGRWWVDVDETGTALGFTPHESRLLAFHLENAGWAKMQDPDGDHPKLKLTLEGFKAIAKLRRPRWRRWIDDNPKTVTVILGAFSVIGTALIVECFKHLLWPGR